MIMNHSIYWYCATILPNVIYIIYDNLTTGQELVLVPRGTRSSLKIFVRSKPNNILSLTRKIIERIMSVILLGSASNLTLEDHLLQPCHVGVIFAARRVSGLRPLH
jgi:hypothetical protein